MASLRLSEIDKRFGAVHAVQKASLEVREGQIHAVVGENGAGKSTLLKIAAGVLVPDAGEVAVDGKRLDPHTAAEAIRRGVGMVQQHFALIPVMTALENVVLGAEPLRGVLGAVDFAVAEKKLGVVLAELGVELPLHAPVESLGIGDRQRLEIARALFRDARILILDEPTAVLTPAEANALYGTLRRLADGGRAVVVVTHKLDEVRAYADVATVLRRGQIMKTLALAVGDDGRGPQISELARAIMAGEGPAEVRREPEPLGGSRLVVSNLRLGRALLGLTLTVQAREVVGVAGVEGNGQRELVRVLAGLATPEEGAARVEGGGRVVVVHEDRQSEGLVLDASVRDNLLLGELSHFSRVGVLDVPAMNREADARAELGRVEPRGLDTIARSLSGGNQQKIVTARAIARARPEDALVVAHPTRGVDLGAARTIQQAILTVAGRGAAVLVVSSDLSELHALCDRILVVARGTIVASFPPAATDAEIGAAMLTTVQPAPVSP